jgi:protein-disulfide isomerase
MLGSARRLSLVLTLLAFSLAPLSWVPDSWAQDAPGPEPELVMGRADAPVTMIEYASLTCGHCATFHTTVLPGLKEKYIATGKVRLIYRDFPLDDLAMTASLLARCTATPDKALQMIGTLFATQETWAVPKVAEAELKKISAQFGLEGSAFDACFKNDALFEKLVQAQEYAEKTLKVEGTPAFFINGTKFQGRPVLEDFDKVLAPLIKN